MKTEQKLNRNKYDDERKENNEENTRKKDNDIDNEEITITMQRFVNVKLFS